MTSELLVAELVHFAVERSVATITLDSPANRNALSLRLVAELVSAIDAARDPGVRAVLLTATGSVFCSGADLSEAASTGAGAAPGFSDLLQSLWDLPKPVVVKLNGHVRAGGLGLVAAADIVIAPATATFAFAEVRIGVAPAMIAVLCCRRMTPRAVGRYLLTGERFDAQSAVDAGLVTVVAEPEEVDARASDLLEEIRSTEPHAVAVTKKLVRDLAALDVDTGLRHAEMISKELFGSPEASEGIAAFKEKRAPRWKV